VIGKELARGGMGVVLAARDVVLGREVAIKMLLSGTESNPVAVRRFMDEARITARLAHPCIPPVYALGTLSDGRPYLAMKLIRGRTLAAVLAAREQRVTTDDDESAELTAFHAPGLLQVFDQICQAVGFAHSQKIVHRDLKPANIMVGAFGEVQVMDWGLARDLSRRSRDGHSTPVPHEVEPDIPAAETCGHADDTDRSRHGEALGTPAYMPPEQARGDWDKVDARADVFALGGILCAILTGKPPYTGRNVMELVKRAVAADLSEAFARLDACQADPALVKLAKWCLAPAPADRPLDGGTVAAILLAHQFDADERSSVGRGPVRHPRRR
jgi:serine/threonine protein kinase